MSMNILRTAWVTTGFLLLAPVVLAAAEVVDIEFAAQRAVETFRRLGGVRATGVEATVYMVYQPDRDHFLQQGEIELLPKEYLVVLTGQLVKKVRPVCYTSDEYVSPQLLETINAVARECEAIGRSVSMETLEQQAGLAPGTLKRVRKAEWVSEYGIVGRVRVNIETGKPVEVMSFKKALPRLSTVAIDETQAQGVIAANGGTGRGELRLVEPAECLFFWCDASDIVKRYVDARTGDYVSHTDMAALIQRIIDAEASMTGNGGGLTFSTMAPVFVEQGMHQDQEDPFFSGLCGPTSVSILFDYWGEHIHHLDVATVCTKPNDGMTMRTEIEHAGMFSHNSASQYDWGTDPDPGQHLEDGYHERDCGYTACRGWVSDHPWESVVELVDERCPFIGHYPTHYLVVIGYAIDGDDQWVGVCNPKSKEDEWVKYTWKDWESSNNSCRVW